MEYMAMIRPAYKIGSRDQYFEARSSEEAVEIAKGLPSIFENLISVYRVESGENGRPVGVRVWYYERDT